MSTNCKVNFRFNKKYQRVSITDSTLDIYKLMNQVEYGDTKILVMRNGVEIGAICPIQDVIVMETGLKKPRTRKPRKKSKPKKEAVKYEQMSFPFFDV